MTAPTTWPNGWQPIDSVPVDVPVLIVAKDLCGRAAVYCASKYAGVSIYGDRYAGWTVLGCGCQEGGTDFYDPKWWQPLPPPPQTPEAQP